VRARRSAWPRESAQGLARDAGRPGSSARVAEPRLDATTNLAFEEPWRAPPKFPLSTALLASVAPVPRAARGHCAACRPRSCRHCCRPLASSSASRSAVVAAAPAAAVASPGRLGRAWGLARTKARSGYRRVPPRRAAKARPLLLLFSPLSNFGGAWRGGTAPAAGGARTSLPPRTPESARRRRRGKRERSEHGGGGARCEHGEPPPSAEGVVRQRVGAPTRAAPRARSPRGRQVLLPSASRSRAAAGAFSAPLPMSTMWWKPS